MHRPTDQEFQRILLAQRARLLALDASLTAQAEELRATPEPDWQDVAAGVTGAAVLTRLDDAERAEIAAIDAALDRLRTGRFGRCVDCDAAIPWRRLRALPHVSKCLKCASAAEQRA